MHSPRRPYCHGSTSATPQCWKSLVLRVAGDLLAVPLARRWGGLLNGVALLLFLGLTVYALAVGRRPSGRLSADDERRLANTRPSTPDR